MRMNMHEYANAVNAAVDDDMDALHHPPTENELRTWKWVKEEMALAEKEGRNVIFDIPFDYD